MPSGKEPFAVDAPTTPPTLPDLPLPSGASAPQCCKLSETITSNHFHDKFVNMYYFNKHRPPDKGHPWFNNFEQLDYFSRLRPPESNFVASTAVQYPVMIPGLFFLPRSSLDPTHKNTDYHTYNQSSPTKYFPLCFRQ